MPERNRRRLSLKFAHEFAVVSKTEEGETGDSRFIGADYSLPSDAESADLLDFEAAAVCFRQVETIPHVKLRFPFSVCAVREPPFLCCVRPRCSAAAGKWLSRCLCRKECFLFQLQREILVFGTPLIEDAGKDWTGQPSGDYNSHKMHLVIIIFER